MNKKVKIIIGVFLVLGVFSTGQAFAKETFRIGVAVPLTGPVAFIGEGIKNAMIIAKDHLDETKYEYEFIFEDNQHDPKMSATIAQKFINIDKVDAIVSISDESGPVVSPMATKSDTLHFAIAVQRYIAKGYNNFMHWTPANEQTSLLVSELQKRGIRRVGVFRATYVGFVELFGAFEENIKGTDIEIVTDQVFDVASTDFRTQITAAKKTDPEIYLILTLPPSLEQLAKQLKEAGVTAPLTACESFDATPTPELFEGNWYISPASAKGCFREAYIKKHGSAPPVATGNGYDIVNLLVTAIESAQSSSKPSAKQISDELHRIRYFNGALGTLYIDQDGVVISKPEVKIIKNGKTAPLYQ